jgi:hypothetical protein
MNPPTETFMMGLLKKSPRVIFVLGIPLMGATIAEARRFRLGKGA